MATVLHCGYCFDSILEHIDQTIEPPHFQTMVTSRSTSSLNSLTSVNSTPTPSPSPSPDTLIMEKYPLFITWKKRNNNANSSYTSERDWKLRGCIGTFTAHELLHGLREYSIISAFKDSRFSPVSAAEIPFLRVDVSLLLHFEGGRHYLDWEIGKHGIQIDFTANGRSYTATYLPDVPTEQRWDRETTVEELIYKSGYRGAVTNKLKQSIRLTRYQTSKASLNYAEYLQLKKELAKQHNSLLMNGNSTTITTTTTTTTTTTMIASNSSKSSASSSGNFITNFARSVLKSVSSPTNSNTNPTSSLNGIRNTSTSTCNSNNNGIRSHGSKKQKLSTTSSTRTSNTNGRPLNGTNTNTATTNRICKPRSNPSNNVNSTAPTKHRSSMNGRKFMMDSNNDLGFSDTDDDSDALDV